MTACDDCGDLTDKPVAVPSVSNDWTCCPRCAGKRRKESAPDFALRPDGPRTDCIHGVDIMEPCEKCDVCKGSDDD